MQNNFHQAIVIFLTLEIHAHHISNTLAYY